MKTKVQVRDLRKGDQLSSGQTILEDPSAISSTPAGYMDIKVQYPNKKERWQIWNKSTKVSITNR